MDLLIAEQAVTPRPENPLKPVSKFDRWVDFVAVHGLITAVSRTNVWMLGKQQLRNALHSASSEEADFSAMASLQVSYLGPDDPYLPSKISPAYSSAMEHPLSEPMKYSDNVAWAAIETSHRNPYHILHLLRRTGLTRQAYRYVQPRGLYAALPKEGGLPTYFAVTQKSKGSEELEVVTPLDDALVASLAHELCIGAEVMINYKPRLIQPHPSHVERILASYPSPTQRLSARFSALERSRASLPNQCEPSPDLAFSHPVDGTAYSFADVLNIQLMPNLSVQDPK